MNAAESPQFLWRKTGPVIPFRLPPLLRIPIDYILHNSALTPLSLTSGPPLGSDHLPLIATYKFND